VGAVTRAWSGKEPCRAVALVQAGLLAAVTPTAVHWLRRGPEGFRLTTVTKAALPAALACFPHYRGHELIVVCAEGTVARTSLRIVTRSV